MLLEDDNISGVQDNASHVQEDALSYRWMLAVMMAVVLSATAGFVRSASADTYDPEELQFLKLINEYRANNGAGPLLLSDELTVSSDHHSEDMAKYGFFAHDTAASSYYPVGSEPWDRMAAEGYGYNTYRGENLAVGYETAGQSFEAWRNSPHHNEAMLDPNYKVIGIVRVYQKGSEWGWYWTTDFGAVVDPSAHPANEPAKPDKKAAKKETPEDQGGDGGGIENGAFKSGAVWKQETKDGAGLILKSEKARFGDYNNGMDNLRQKVQIKKHAKLSYRLEIKAQEKLNPSDQFLVQLTDADGKKVALLKTYDAGDKGGWRRETNDLSRFAGRTLYLDFLVKTDESHLTTFFLDDVALKN